MNILRIIWIFFTLTMASSNKVRIGALFPLPQQSQKTLDFFSQYLDNSKIRFDDRARLAFLHTLLSLNQENSSEYSIVKNIFEYSEGTELVFQITKQVCAQLSLGVAALVTSRRYDVIQSACSAKRMVHINIGQSQREDKKMDAEMVYTFNVNPSIETWNLAVADLIFYYQWKKVSVIYCKNIEAVQSLVESLNTLDTEVLLLNANSSQALYLIARIIKKRGIRKVVVACDSYQLLLNILKLVLKNEMDRDYQYIVYGLAALPVLEQNYYTFGQLNITTLTLLSEPTRRNIAEQKWDHYIQSMLESKSASQVQDGMIENRPDFAFSVDVALMYDAIAFYDVTLRKLRQTKPLRFNHRSLPCDRDDKWLFGPELMQALKNSTYNGITGPVSFNKWGHRSKVVLDVVSITHSGLKKVGKWKSSEEADTFSKASSYKRIEMSEQVFSEEKHTSSYHNRTLKITMIVESPYVFKNVSTDPSGSSQIEYTGYCVDLLNYLAEDLQFFYDITEVRDNLYGNFILQNNSWDGMIGELLRGEADMAVAPLTINYDRERAVKFTKPYMSLGIGILYRTPQAGTPNFFGFFDPLSIFIWVLIIAAYILVSVIMFCIARLSPYEWQEMETSEKEAAKMENSFGLLDSLWFGIGALMQQGSDIAPRSISTRLLAGVWWFFTLILISSYTANLAAFLTVTRMESDISSAEDLARQIKIEYGTLRDGATASFFKNSMLPTFSKMWHFMNETPGVFADTNEEGILRVLKGKYAYLMESSTMEYTINGNCNLTQIGGLLDSRGYGIATTKSKLRDNLSVSILKLQENGVLDKLKHKWWKEDASKCPGEDTSSSTQSLRWTNLGGAFVFLCCGATVAIFTAIFEFCFYSYSNARSKKKTIRKELKLGLGSICSCRNQIVKTSFFEEVVARKEGSSSHGGSCLCSCVPMREKMKELPERCSQINCSGCGLRFTDSRRSVDSQENRRYCDRFSSMVETVLADHNPQTPHGCLSVVTDGVTSSLNSSKDPDSGVATYPAGFSRQACFQDTTLESDLGCSSCSLQGGSPNQFLDRYKNDSGKHINLQSCFEELRLEKERHSSVNPNFRREGREIRRWKFANGRSTRYTSQFERRPSEFFQNSTLCLESENETDSPIKNGFSDFSNLKQTVM